MTENTPASRTTEEANAMKGFTIPEEDRERMRRDEMNAMVYMQCAIAAMGYCWKDLRNRLEYIPAGVQRFKMAMGAMKSIFDDLHETLPTKSERRMSTISHDFKIVLVPKPTSEPQKLVLDRDDAIALMEATIYRCKDCVKSDEEARKSCRLYSILETYMPLNDYGDGLMCEYGKRQIE